jgi:hypothetical protein
MYLFVSFSFAGHFFFSSFGALVLVSERQIVLSLQWDRLPPPRTHQQNKTKPRNKSHQKLPVQVGSSIRRKAERRGRLYYNCPIIRGRRTAADKSINHQLDRGLQLSRLLFFFDLLLFFPTNYTLDSGTV